MAAIQKTIGDALASYIATLPGTPAVPTIRFTDVNLIPERGAYPIILITAEDDRTIFQGFSNQRQREYDYGIFIIYERAGTLAYNLTPKEMRQRIRKYLDWDGSTAAGRTAWLPTVSSVYGIQMDEVPGAMIEDFFSGKDVAALYVKVQNSEEGYAGT